MVLTKIRQIWNPPMFQGSMNARHYFEGWYYKFVDASEEQVFAFIPGVSLGMDAKGAHSFIQWLNGKTGKFEYFEFAVDAFKPSKKSFDVMVDKNHFSLDEMRLSIDQKKHAIDGRIGFVDPIEFPKSFGAPGVMGWYTFVPRMQCKHGVVSMHHGLSGSLMIDGSEVVFDGGRGYIEKDFGMSFPKAYIWMQSNHFDDRLMSFMLSIATIPWFGKSFTGFLCVLWVNDEVLNFSTYRGGRISSFEREGNRLDVVIETRRYCLEVGAVKDKGWALKSPELGAMTSRIFESLTSVISVRLVDKRDGSVVVSGEGRNAGLEMMDDEGLLVGGLR